MYWADHWKHSHFSTPLAEWDKFIRQNIFHWFECLSLLDSLGVSITALRTVADSEVPHYIDSQIHFVKDALRFIQLNFDAVQFSCLDLYHSALVWVPSQSLIRSYYPDLWTSNLPQVTHRQSLQWEGPGITISTDPFHANIVTISPNGHFLASGLSDSLRIRTEVRIWDVHSLREKQLLFGHERPIISLAFSHDNHWLVSGWEDTTVRIWNLGPVETQPPILRGHLASVYAVAFSPDSLHVCSGSGDCTVRVWNVETGKEEHVLSGHFGSVTGISYTSDGLNLLSASHDTTIHVWKLYSDTYRCKTILRGHTGPIISVGYSPSSNKIVTGSTDETARIWDLDSGKTLHILWRDYHRVSFVEFSPDGLRVALSSAGSKAIHLWNAADGRLLHVFEGHAHPVTSLCFFPSGRQIVSSSTDGTVAIWNIQEPVSPIQSKTKFDAYQSALYYILYILHFLQSLSNGLLLQPVSPVPASSREILLLFSPDGKRIASCSPQGYLQILNAENAEEERSISYPGHNSSLVMATAFSPKDEEIAFGTMHGGIFISGTLKGSPRLVAQCKACVHAVCFSPDARWIASATIESEVAIWLASSTNSQHFTIQYGGNVSKIAFSPNGRLLVIGLTEGMIHIYDLDPYKEVYSFHIGAGDNLEQMMIMLNGESIVTCSTNNTSVWDISTGKIKWTHNGFSSWTTCPDGRLLSVYQGAWICQSRDFREPPEKLLWIPHRHRSNWGIMLNGEDGGKLCLRRRQDGELVLVWLNLAQE